MPERPIAVRWRDCPSCRGAQFLAHAPWDRRWLWSCGSCGRTDAGSNSDRPVERPLFAPHHAAIRETGNGVPSSWDRLMAKGGMDR